MIVSAIASWMNRIRRAISAVGGAFGSLGRRSVRPQDLATRHALSLAKQRTFPSLGQWKQLPRLWSPQERLAMQTASSIAALCVLFIAGWFVFAHRLTVPSVGGEYTEALVGEPQFLNPLYASASDVDMDLTRLLYSGLFTWDPSAGLVPDLAKSYTVSEDQKTYTVVLRDDARFHNGTAVKADDVVFTIQSIQQPAYRSPLAISFRGVEASQVDEHTVQFVLEEPFASFLSTLTVGILPSELWEEIAARNAPIASLNLQPVGSGPFQFERYSVDKKGSIRSYSVVRNPDYYAGAPFLERLTFKFYPDAASAVSALKNRNVEGVGFVPVDELASVATDRSVHMLRPSIPLLTALYFNPSKQSLFQADLRKALSLGLDRQAVVNAAAPGEVKLLNGPMPEGTIGFDPELPAPPFDTAAAAKALDDLGFAIGEDGTRAKVTKSGTTETRTELAFTLTVVDQSETVRAAEAIAAQWGALGVKITIAPIAASSLLEDVIRPNAYELLLTGTQLGLDADPYPYWHSSQSSGAGLNLARYSNREVDGWLQQARQTLDQDKRRELYRAFAKTVATEFPAIFLYQSQYRYALSEKIKNVELPSLRIPSDRFWNVHAWFIKSKTVIGE